MKKYIKVRVDIGELKNNEFLWDELKDEIQLGLESSLDFSWNRRRDELRRVYLDYKLSFDSKGSKEYKRLMKNSPNKFIRTTFNLKQKRIEERKKEVK